MPYNSGLTGHPCCTAVNNKWPVPGQYELTCDYINNLVSNADHTVTAKQSGNWSNAAVWGGRAPSTWTTSDHVFIPAGITVTVDGTNSTAFLSLTVDGLLIFSPTANTSLTVNTIITGRDISTPGVPQGEINIGTPLTPIGASYTAAINFADLGTLSSVWPNDYIGDQMAMGLISMGCLSIVGATVTPYVPISNVSAGVNTLTCLVTPVGWAAGHVLVLPGTSNSADQTEKVTIQSISGTSITLTGNTAHAHQPPTKGGYAYAANTYRNVTLTGPNTGITHRAHVMQCHNNACQIQYAAFVHLGRTDKSVVLDNGDPSQGLPAANHLGRYALHLHRTYFEPGFSQNDPPVLVQYNYCEESPGWGIVNHSSNVSMDFNVCYNIFGAAFVTEAGNELGQITSNLSCTTPGVSNTYLQTASRFPYQDFGWNGQGFWLTSPYVTLQNNLAYNCQIGYDHYPLGLTQTGIGTTTGWNGENISKVEFAPWSNNLCGVAAEAVQVQWAQGVVPNYSKINNCIGWGLTYAGIDLFRYAYRFVISNPILLGVSGSVYGIRSSTGGYTFEEHVINCDIEGFTNGILTPSSTNNSYKGGYIDCPTAFYICQMNYVRNVTISGTWTFGGTVTTKYYLQPLQDLYKYANSGNTGGSAGWPNALLYPDQVILPDGSALYDAQQVGTYVPYSAGPWGGLTTTQLSSQYGKAPRGQVAPASATTDASTNALKGPPQTTPFYALTTGGYPPTTKRYTVAWNLLGTSVNGSGNSYTIVPGLQLVTATIKGTNQVQGWLVYGHKPLS